MTRYEKESNEHKPESMAIAKVVLLLAKEQKEELKQLANDGAHSANDGAHSANDGAK